MNLSGWLMVLWYPTNVTYKRRPRYSDHSVDVMTSKERIQFSRELEAILKGSHYKDLSLAPPERKSINLKEIIVPGKYNFIDFWASWCGPCRAAIPSVKQLQQKLGDKLNIISISVDKKRQDWERAMEVEKMTFLFGRKSEVIERKNILWRFLNKVLVPVIQKKENFDT